MGEGAAREAAGEGDTAGETAAKADPSLLVFKGVLEDEDEDEESHRTGERSLSLSLSRSLSALSLSLFDPLDDVERREEPVEVRSGDDRMARFWLPPNSDVRPIPSDASTLVMAFISACFCKKIL